MSEYKLSPEAQEELARIKRKFKQANDKANGENKSDNAKSNYRPAELLSRRAADIPPEHIHWSWVCRLARGKHTCIAGEPGTGKSLFSDFVPSRPAVTGHAARAARLLATSSSLAPRIARPTPLCRG